MIIFLAEELKTCAVSCSLLVYYLVHFHIYTVVFMHIWLVFHKESSNHRRLSLTLDYITIA